MIAILMRLNKSVCAGLVVAIGILNQASIAGAQVAKIEVHPLQSTTLTDDEFLAGKKEGRPVTLAGELRIPRPGSGRLPAVIIVHGSSGVVGSVADWSQLLNSVGVATFTLDSFTGRGIASTVEDQDRLGRLSMIVDAYRALDLLTSHPRIDPARIAIMGFSRGGVAALYASLRRFQRAHATAGNEFAGYLAFYTSCATKYRGDEDVSDKPIRIFLGDADDFGPVAPCRSFVDRLRANGKDISLTEYANAGHAFDSAGLAKPLRIPNAQVWWRCNLEEAADGTVVNVETKKSFTFKDACVERGATVAYDAEAHKAAQRAVREFVVNTLGAK